MGRERTQLGQQPGARQGFQNRRGGVCQHAVQPVGGLEEQLGQDVQPSGIQEADRRHVEHHRPQKGRPLLPGNLPQDTGGTSRLVRKASQADRGCCGQPDLIHTAAPRHRHGATVMRHDSRTRASQLSAAQLLARVMQRRNCSSQSGSDVNYSQYQSFARRAHHELKQVLLEAGRVGKAERPAQADDGGHPLQLRLRIALRAGTPNTLE